MCEKHLLWAVFNKPVWDAGNASDDWEVKIFLKDRLLESELSEPSG